MIEVTKKAEVTETAERSLLDIADEVMACVQSLPSMACLVGGVRAHELRDLVVDYLLRTADYLLRTAQSTINDQRAAQGLPVIDRKFIESLNTKLSDEQIDALVLAYEVPPPPPGWTHEPNRLVPDEDTAGLLRTVLSADDDDDMSVDLVEDVAQIRTNPDVFDAMEKTLRNAVEVCAWLRAYMAHLERAGEAKSH